MSDPSLTPPPNPLPSPAVSRPARPSLARRLLPWVLGTAVVLTLAITAGLLTAYFVANMKAVPTVAALASPTPGPFTPAPSQAPSGSPGATLATDQPRRTPSPAPIITPAPTPLVHIVQRHETLTAIAALYGVTVDDILALNDITDPNTIHPGDQLLIPGWAPLRP